MIIVAITLANNAHTDPKMALNYENVTKVAHRYGKQTG